MNTPPEPLEVDDETLSARLFDEACERLQANPEASIEDLRQQVPPSEKESFQSALEGWAIVRFADSKGLIDWDRWLRD